MNQVEIGGAIVFLSCSLISKEVRGVEDKDILNLLKKNVFSYSSEITRLWKRFFMKLGTKMRIRI
jgi:hypothetical protein